MERVTIYGRSGCGFCTAARELCEIKDIPYRYVDMIAEGISKADLERTINRPVRTVPQILVGDQYIGGFDQFSRYVRQSETATAR